MYTIGIVGAGYTGGRLAAYFRAKKQKVWAVSRSSEKKKWLESLGAEAVLTDLAQAGSLEIPPAHFIVIALAPEERTPEAYRKIYLEAAGRVLDAVRKNPRPFLIVYLSSTGVYGASQGGLLDESVPPEPENERAKILLEAERQVLESGYPAAVFRLAGIYGPGRNVLVRLKEGRELETEERTVNMILVEDVVENIPLFFKAAQAGEIYLGVDDLPVKRSELYAWLASKSGLPFPETMPKSSEGGKRYGNAKLKRLGAKLKFPTFREGYTAILESMELEKK